MTPNVYPIITELILQDTYAWNPLFKLYVHSRIACKETGIFSVRRS